MTTLDSVKRSSSHLFFTMTLVGAVFVGGPYALAKFGLMSELKPYAWVILIVALFGIFFKAVIGYLITKEFQYDKAAYDLSAVAFGGILTCAALEVVSEQTLFTGLQSMRFLEFMSVFGLESKGQNVAVLFILLLASILVTIVAAVGVHDTANGKFSSCRTLVTSFFSYVFIAVYALALIAKE